MAAMTMPPCSNDRRSGHGSFLRPRRVSKRTKRNCSAAAVSAPCSSTTTTTTLIILLYSFVQDSKLRQVEMSASALHRCGSGAMYAREKSSRVVPRSSRPVLESIYTAEYGSHDPFVVVVVSGIDNIMEIPSWPGCSLRCNIIILTARCSRYTECNGVCGPTRTSRSDDDCHQWWWWCCSATSPSLPGTTPPPLFAVV